MQKLRVRLIGAVAFGAASVLSTAALAGVTIINPFSDMNPSLAVTMVTPQQGIFPSNGGNGSASGDTLGFVYNFGGNFAPGTSYNLQGQSLPIAPNTAIFSLVGTTYGGNGTSNFNLPNLQGATPIGAGLPGQQLGVPVGASSVSLTPAQIPTQSQAAQPFNTQQPALPLTPLIAVSGVFPSQGGGGGSAAFIGQVADFAGNFTPDGWLPAAGQILSISQNVALFSVIGTTYGGNGTTTFALPDLEGRTMVGADQADPLGTAFGHASTALTLSELPPGGAPVNIEQPALALNYIIAISGIFPSQGGGAGFNANIPTLGQISAFAGDFAPSGWALADGQLLSISQYSALFAVIGDTYGGDGITTFALPNLDGRTLIGADGADPVGTTLGANEVVLTGSAATVPEPAAWALMLLGVGLTGGLLRRRARAGGEVQSLRPAAAA